MRTDTETYNSIVLAADRVSAAGVSTDTDNGDGAAADTNKSVDGTEHNPEQTGEESDQWVSSLQ